jgi:hypothetical protein
MTRRTVAAAAVLFLLSCTEDAQVGDLAGYVDSIGPASFDGESLSIPFSTWDEDGDRLDVDVSFSRGDGAFETIAILEGLASDAAVSTPHTFVWDITDANVETASLRFRMFVVDRPGSELILGPLTPATLNDD